MKTKPAHLRTVLATGLWCLLALLPISAMSAPFSYSYTLRWAAPGTYTYIVELQVPVQGLQTEFKMPAWRPGRYMLQNYAAGVSAFAAKDGAGNSLACHKTDKDTWVVATPAGSGTVTISYRWYARTLDAGSSYVDDKMVYFNGSNLFMYVPGQLDAPCTLRLPDLPDGWKAATALRPGADARSWAAGSYHDLVDCPSIFSPSLVTFTMDVEGFPVSVHFQGNYRVPAGQEQTFLDNVKQIIITQKKVFGEIPAPYYHFIYLLLPNKIRHAVEHSRCSMYAMTETVAENGRKLGELLSITSHEFWHTWNVKAIRPAAMWPYDYSREAYTTLHWFTEGVTDYYTSLTLARAGIYHRDQYLGVLNTLFTNLENDYAQTVVSPAQSSYDTWLTTSPYNCPWHQISFYALGARVGFLLDVELRRVSDGKVTFDDLFRYLYANYYKQNLGVPEDGILKAANTLTGKDFRFFFATFVDGPAPYPYDTVLTPMGLHLNDIEKPEATVPECLGISMSESYPQGLFIQRVRPGTDAFDAGLREGDLLVTLNGKPLKDWTAADLKRRSNLKAQVIRADALVDVPVYYTGLSIPRQYSLVVTDPAKAAWIDAWLWKEPAPTPPAEAPEKEEKKRNR